MLFSAWAAGFELLGPFYISLLTREWQACATPTLFLPLPLNRLLPRSPFQGLCGTLPGCSKGFLLAPASPVSPEACQNLPNFLFLLSNCVRETFQFARSSPPCHLRRFAKKRDMICSSLVLAPARAPINQVRLQRCYGHSAGCYVSANLLNYRLLLELTKM